MSRLSSPDAATVTPEASDTRSAEAEAAAEALADRLRGTMGEALVDSHSRGHTHWIRVQRDAWADLAGYLRNDEGFEFFNFLSAIDWLPSPFGRDMDSAVDNVLNPPEPAEPSESAESAEPSGSTASAALETGVAGGASRFQLLARVNDVTTGRSVIAKADLPDDDLSAPSWVPIYSGANWHEREAWEMFGINFPGHPGLRHLYLPGEFEGHPLRKDYPLLARRVKPWPGLVDVELMPEIAENETADTGASAAEDSATESLADGSPAAGSSSAGSSSNGSSAVSDESGDSS